MSSRALRKAQREREEQEHLQRLKEEAEALESSDGEDDEEPILVRPQKSAFAMLEEADADEEDEDEAEAGEPAAEEDKDTASHKQEDEAAPRSEARRKKKKKKATVKPAKDVVPARDSSLDDIDLALKSLSTSNATPSKSTTVSDPIVTETCRLLSIDTQHLHAANEMRRLFGRAALDAGDEDEQNGGGRRRNRAGQQAGLAAALGRRQGAQGGGRSSGLGLLGLRRNIFIQGKEEWPVATAGGLGMEIVEKREDGTVEYRFVHNKAYQDVQGQFEACVASMDPQRMVQLLQFNPYHISTLLQVSEIAKQERDHATSGDLLERALFSFGRAVHSTFAANLSQGKARLDFRRPENREFGLFRVDTLPILVCGQRGEQCTSGQSYCCLSTQKEIRTV